MSSPIPDEQKFYIHSLFNVDELHDYLINRGWDDAEVAVLEARIMTAITVAVEEHESRR